MREVSNIYRLDSHGLRADIEVRGKELSRGKGDDFIQALRSVGSNARFDYDVETSSDRSSSSPEPFTSDSQPGFLPDEVLFSLIVDRIDSLFGLAYNLRTPAVDIALMQRKVDELMQDKIESTSAQTSSIISPLHDNALAVASSPFIAGSAQIDAHPPEELETGVPAGQARAINDDGVDYQSRPQRR